ncbi:unnamed protein product [Acanthoscelides obtectus]|uniref:Uncharacterized protein n=1 Tax=Acanthoscelides obtectus TaxID=200917 RepID=A0A9P0KKE2_ACAOB|nr:unnamed protein product [Acanthoscelides obtectus]CAK1631377.1 hypothetical protein AOBTE_LOCUS6917 [Acanthoscelides obtectus]
MHRGYARAEAQDFITAEVIPSFPGDEQVFSLADDSGNVIEDEYMKYVKELLAEAPYMNSMVDKIAQDCLKEADTEEASDGGCNPTAIKLAHCLFRDIQLNCPEDQIEDKQSCEMLQERLKSGPPPQSR